MDNQEAIARRFHESYERLAPSYGYETREDTKEFDPESKNGRLMTAVCGEIAEAIERAAEALVADWLGGQAAEERARAEKEGRALVAATDPHHEARHARRMGRHEVRAGALREAAEAVRQGRARREGGAAEGGGRPEYQPPPPPSRAVGNASAAELAGLSPMGRLETHAAADERARIRQMALDLAEKWETAEGDDVPNTKADLEWKAEGVRDFAALLETRP